MNYEELVSIIDTEDHDKKGAAWLNIRAQLLDNKLTYDNLSDDTFKEICEEVGLDYKDTTSKLKLLLIDQEGIKFAKQKVDELLNSPDLDKKAISAAKDELALITVLGDIKEQVIDFILDHDLYFVQTDDLIWSKKDKEVSGVDFIARKDTAIFKAYPHLFSPSYQHRQLGVKSEMVQGMFRKSLQELQRIPEKKVVTMKATDETVFNVAPDPSKWLKPIFDQSHHVGFDYVMNAIYADPGARQNYLKCLAWKYCKPWVILPSSISCGSGGAGKTGLNEKTLPVIFGKEAVIPCATLDSELMKNNGAIRGKMIVVFDDMRKLHEASEEYAWIKKTIQAETFQCRDKYEKEFTADCMTWFEFNGNKINGEHTPVPLVGDGMTGVDRRFSPNIVKTTLVSVVMNGEGISEKEAINWVDLFWKNEAVSPEEVAKWLGNIITNSGVLDPLAEAPKAYHGADYTLLTNEKNTTLLDVFDFVFKERSPHFISVKDFKMTYDFLCDEIRVPQMYRLSSATIKERVDDLIKGSIVQYDLCRERPYSGGRKVGWEKTAFGKLTKVQAGVNDRLIGKHAAWLEQNDKSGRWQLVKGTNIG